MDMAYDRLLARATDEAKNLERPQVRVLGRIISQMEQMNVSMRDIREQIRQDVRAKRRYFREEAKLLKKDSDNLNDVKANILGGLRGKGAAILGATGAAQLSQGNVGGAAQSFGLAGLLLAPEIVEFLTGSVVNVLALKGLIGNKGVGATNVARGVGGASKLRNPLLITAALAASLLIPSLAQAGQSGDRRRQELATKVISGEQTINKPDVTRFRNQLNRFDRILSSVSLGRKKSNQDTIDLEELEKDDKKEGDKNKIFGVDVKEGGIAGSINRFFNKDSSEEKVTEEVTNNNVTNKIEDNTKIDLSSNIQGDTIEGDNIVGDIATTISLLSNISENNIFNDNISNIIESNDTFASGLLANLDIPQMRKQNTPSTTKNNVINLSSEQKKESSSGFSGFAAKPSVVQVTTKFRSGGGTIDKFEAASSLRSYGAFS
jgi:hypothetical protein